MWQIDEIADSRFVAYVAGCKIGVWRTYGEAKRAALQYVRRNGYRNKSAQRSLESV